LSSTQLGLQRLKGKSDSYQPGTLPPRLYQSNPFAQQTKPTETGEILYELTAQEVPATAKEIQDVQDVEADEETLSQAVETLMATTARTRAGRKRKASSKATNNTELEALKKGRRGGRGG
jgi:hypothetical protein